MAKSTLRLVAPQDKAVLDEAIDLMCKTFRFDRNFHKSLRHTRQHYVGSPNYDPSVSRVGFLGDELVTHFGIWAYDLRVGSATLRCAGIGAVSTHGDHRRKGLMAQTARAAIQASREAGYDVSTLFGVQDFYDQFGYVRGWSDHTHTVNLDDLPSGPPRFAPRKLIYPTCEEAIRLYNREYAGYTGTAVRPTYGVHKPPWFQAWQWSDARGRMLGYVVACKDDRRLRCVEVVGNEEQALRVLRRLADRMRCDRVALNTIPYRHPLLKRLRRGNCRIEWRLTRAGDAMIRMLNLESALHRMRSELSDRLKQSAMADWQGKLLIRDQWDQATLTIGRGKVTVGPGEASRHRIVGREHVAQFLIGTDEPGEVIESGRMKIGGDGAKLAAALFPAQDPSLLRLDHF